MSDYFYRRCPMLHVFGPRSRINFLQPVRGGLLEGKAEPVAGVLQFLQARSLPLLVAALCHGHIDDAHPGFTLQSQRKPSNDAFIVRMRRKNEDDRRPRRRTRLSVRWNAPERERASP